MNATIVLGILGASIALLLVVPDWRPALLLAGLCGACAAAISYGELTALGGADAASEIGVLAAIDIVALVCAGAILLWTGLTYERSDPQQTNDEVEQMQVRRAARRAARAVVPQGWAAYRLPLLAVVLLVAGTALLPWSLATPATSSVYSWTLLVLGGILVAATSDGLLKLGIGLTLLAFGLKVCYLSEAATIAMADLLVFSLVPIVVAVVVALLCMAVYARLGTLRLALLFEHARPTSSASSVESANDAS